MNVLQILATCILPHDEKPLLPDTQERALLKLGSAMLLMDTYQYWGHRLLHTQGLFTTVHIVHHRVRQLFAWAALYNSYIETLLLDIASFMLVESICGLTPYQAQGFAIFSTLKTVSDHSGYMLPWDPFTWFSNNAAYHAVHHKNRAYNFQQPFFTFWDELMGTKAIPGQL
jgi:sphinganine C4-monooxygenase